MTLRTFLEDLVLFYNHFSLYYLLVINAVNTVLFVLAVRGIRQYRKRFFFKFFVQLVFQAGSVFIAAGIGKTANLNCPVYILQFGKIPYGFNVK